MEIYQNLATPPFFATTEQEGGHLKLPISAPLACCNAALFLCQLCGFSTFFHTKSDVSSRPTDSATRASDVVAETSLSKPTERPDVKITGTNTADEKPQDTAQGNVDKAREESQSEKRGQQSNILKMSSPLLQCEGRLFHRSACRLERPFDSSRFFSIWKTLNSCRRMRVNCDS